MKKKKDKISTYKLNKYFKVTETALGIVEKSIIKGKEKEADEIIQMASNYVCDARYFEARGEIVTAFAALNYAHGWLDAGVRLDVFKVSNDKLFTVK